MAWRIFTCGRSGISFSEKKNKSEKIRALNLPSSHHTVQFALLLFCYQVGGSGAAVLRVFSTSPHFHMQTARNLKLKNVC